MPAKCLLRHDRGPYLKVSVLCAGDDSEVYLMARKIYKVSQLPPVSSRLS